MKNMNKIGLSAIFGVVALSLGACNDNDEIIYRDSESDSPVVTRLNVSPRNVTMGFVDEQEFLVSVRPAVTEITWESSDPEIAYVDENNKIVPVGCGEVEFTAKAGELTAKATVTIHSSVIADAYAFMEMGGGQASTVPTLQVLPEGTPYTVTSSNEDVISVSDQQITAISAGVSTLSIETDDGQEHSITIGVTDEAHSVTATKAVAFSYKGDVLGHPAYDISALTLAPASATYADGGVWSGTGSGLFLKLYRNAAQSSIPDGTYTPGTSEFNYYTNGRSYVIDAETGTKENISFGDVEISADGVSAKLIAGSHAWTFNFTGTRTESPHYYETESVTYNYTNADFKATGTVAIDHKGQYFYGGYGNGWQFQLPFLDSGNIQIMLWSKTVNSIAAEYPLDKGFCTQGTIGIMGWGTTSKITRNGSFFFTGGTPFQTPGFERTTEGSTKYVTLGFKGTFSYNSSSPVTEIGETRNIPTNINLDVTNYKFRVSRETALP